MKILFRRGLEENRENITPEIGELIYTEDTKRIYIGDGETPGGNLVCPIVTLEWNFNSAVDQTKYSPSENEDSFHDPSLGTYLVFYGAVKLSKTDYSINYEENKLILNIEPIEDNIEISVNYIGI